MHWYGINANDPPGAEDVWRIVTPASELRYAVLRHRWRERVEWVAPSAPDAALDIMVLLSFGLPEGLSPFGDAPSGRCLLRWRLGNGAELFLFARSAPLVDESRRYFPEQSALPLPEDWRADAEGRDHRMLMWVDTAEGRGCFDIAHRGR